MEDMVRDLTVEDMEEITMVLLGVITDLMSQPTMTSPMEEARTVEEDHTVVHTTEQLLTPMDPTVVEEDTVVHTDQTLTPVDLTMVEEDLTVQQALTPVDLTVLEEHPTVEQPLTQDLTVVHTEQTLTLDMTTSIPLKRHSSWSTTSTPTLTITPLAPTLIHLTEEPTATVNLPPTTRSTRPAPTMEGHPTQEDPLMEDLTTSMIKLPPTLAITPLTPTLVHLMEETTAMYLRLLSTTSIMEDHHTM